MKVATLNSLGILSILAGVAYFQSDFQVQPPQTVQSPSQADTQVDTSSARDLLDYTLTSIGEQDLTQIRERLFSASHHEKDLTIDEDLFETFILYKTALAELEPNGFQTLNLLALEQINQQILDLQNQYFTPQQITLLFDEENRLRQLAIDKMDINTRDLDPDSKAQLLQETLASQPDYIQRAERDNLLMAQLNQSLKQDQQNKYLTRVNLVGEEGAHRLEQLDQQREIFNQSLENYLQKRQDILSSPSLSDDLKHDQIAELRQQSFDTKQWRRVEALERIYDQQ
ncbi:lipase chaperone [Vibrio zhanjiangensis]|uniref:Lipase chaperone n=1 Tax=Vibrio zhanjiangensis TaxID=1046128 RepID=A0ABQ6F1N4_9VIBR|nr:lipase secretion chaperone [Vibrio zhanjiangensis]GLT19360.1 lipase chaperone [Vibrio zhanjiangensis]